MTDLNNKLSTAWEGFAAGDWQKEVNVRDFIQKTTLPMKATKLSWRAPAPPRRRCGKK
ncbi:hypothetical protein SODG_000428 [Sodalis praecaptivus]